TGWRTPVAWLFRPAAESRPAAYIQLILLSNKELAGVNKPNIFVSKISRDLAHLALITLMLGAVVPPAFISAKDSDSSEESSKKSSDEDQGKSNVDEDEASSDSESASE